jgi:hypothetical protein
MGLATAAITRRELDRQVRVMVEGQNVPIVPVMTCSGGTAAFGKHGLIPSRVFLAPAPTTASSTDFHHRGLAKETDQIS